MSATPHEPDMNTPAGAITRVLDAEKSARLEISSQRRKALEILRKARSQTRVIARRADARIGLVQRLTEASVQHQLATMQAEARQYAGTPRITQELVQKLDVATDRLIDELIA